MASPRDASLELPDLGQQISARLAQAPGVIDRRFSVDRVQRLESLASGLPLLDIVRRRWSAGQDETQQGSSELPYVVTPRPAVPDSPAPSPAASREVPTGQVRKLPSPLAAAPAQLPVQRLPVEPAELPSSAIGSALAPTGPQAAMPIVQRLAGGPPWASSTVGRDIAPPAAAGSEKAGDAAIVSSEAQRRLDPPASSPAPELQELTSLVQRSSSVVPEASSTAQAAAAPNQAGAPAPVLVPVSPPAVPPTPRLREQPQLVRLSSGGGPSTATPIARQGAASPGAAGSAGVAGSSPGAVSSGGTGRAEAFGLRPGSSITPEQRNVPTLSVQPVSEQSPGAMPRFTLPLEAQPKVAEGTLTALVAAEPGGQLPPAGAPPAAGMPGVMPRVDVPEAVAMPGRTQPGEHLSAPAASVAERPADSAGLTAAAGSAAPAVRAGFPVPAAPASASLPMAPAGSPHQSGRTAPTAMVMPSREYPASVQARTEPVSSLVAGARDLPWSGPVPARLPDAGYPAAASPVQLGAPATEFVLARGVEPGSAEMGAVQREDQAAGSGEPGAAPAGSPRQSGRTAPTAMVMPSREYPTSVQARTEPVLSPVTDARDLPWSAPVPARLPDAGYPAAASPVQLGAPASEYVMARRIETGSAETFAVQREEQAAGSDESGTASMAGRTTSVTTQQSSGAESARPPSQEIDLERLTDQVMILLEQRLTVERERLGL
ncbi:MAG: hypothetical protein MUC51_05735 [Anaerolineae bacterium]|nr:hypothetical protein [Anaerolineae bacterium]